jgi:ATP:ADP antiporter, AAA family
MVFTKTKQRINKNYQKFRHSKVRYAVWPIRSFELFKFTPMVFLMFTILLNQNIVRSIKDSLVMTEIGAEVINFIKLWVEMPLGIIFVFFYTKLCNKVSTESAFRYVISFFLLFYTLFAFYIYPHRHELHPNPEMIMNYVNLYPHFKWPILMVGKWSYVLMYGMGELWPLVAFSLLFWQLANKITRVDEAARFYPFFTIFGQANCLIAGSVIIYFSSGDHIFSNIFYLLDSKAEIIIKSLTLVVLISGIICIGLQTYVEKHIMEICTKKKYDKLEKKSKIKVGFFDSFKLVMNQPYLLYIATIVIAYNFSINLIEGTLMSKASKSFPLAENFINFQGNMLFWIGIFTIFCALVGANLIKKFGWMSAAILTPLVLMVTGMCFFQAVIFEDSMYKLKHFFPALVPALAVVYIGAVQHVLTKGLKYSLCDATKEMAYIPLNQDQKTSGKAAVDIVGTKVGKSFGSILQISLFTIYPSYSYENFAVVLLCFLVVVCIMWTYAVIKLSKLYNKKIIE